MTTERILIVDDDELVRTGLALDLEEDGYEVVMAASAEEALALLESGPFHLVLSDLVMAEMDGMALLNKVRSRMPDVAFIMITGHGTVGRALDAMKQGANDFIQKPADPEVIRHRVRSVLDDLHLRRNLLAEHRKERAQKEALQKRMIRDQRMVSLGRLADGVSDYLAEVLNPIFQCARDVMKTMPEDHPIRSKAVEVEDSARKAMSLIQDLQTIGHGARLREETVSLDAVMQDYLRSEEMVEIKKRAPRVRLEYRAPPDLPLVAGSSTLLQAMIRNVIAHAIEGMPDGGLLSIELRTQEMDKEAGERAESSPHGEYVVLSIRDTAAQLPAQDMDRLFEPFQPRQVGERLVSTGLGLSVVYRVVQEHHGFVDVQARAGEGTAFNLFFPIAASGVAAEAAIDITPLGGSETILLLDDHDEQRAEAAHMLEGLGYEVIHASSGRQAIEAVKKAERSGGRQHIDLAVLDLVLGDAFDGLETYKKILEIKPDQRAILISGFAEFSRIVEARKLGLGRYVQKPYRVETLGQAVRAELDR